MFTMKDRNVISSIEKALKFEMSRDANIRFICQDGELVTKSINFKLHSNILYAMFADIRNQSLHEYCVVIPDITKDILIHLTNIISTGFSKIDKVANMSELIQTAKLLGIGLNYLDFDLEHVKTEREYLETKLEDTNYENEKLDSLKVEEASHSLELGYFEDISKYESIDAEDKLQNDVIEIIDEEDIQSKQDFVDFDIQTQDNVIAKPNVFENLGSDLVIKRAQQPPLTQKSLKILSADEVNFKIQNDDAEKNNEEDIPSNRLSDYEKIRECNIREKNVMFTKLFSTAMKESKADEGKSKERKKWAKRKYAVGRENLRSHSKTYETGRRGKEVYEVETPVNFRCDFWKCGFQSQTLEELYTHKKISHSSLLECGDCIYVTEHLAFLRSHVYHKSHKMKIDYETIAYNKAKKKSALALKCYKNRFENWKKKIEKDREGGRYVCGIVRGPGPV